MLHHVIGYLFILLHWAYSLVRAYDYSFFDAKNIYLFKNNNKTKNLYNK